MDVREAIQSGILLFDGAMGTMLQRRGLALGALPELWNLEQPDVVTEIHREYVEAGADVVTTNTFQAHTFKLRDEKQVRDVVAAGVRCAKASGARFTALDVGPLGRLLEPMGPLEFERAYEMFRLQMTAGEEAGADLILIETFSDPYETKAAVLAAKEGTSLPVICSMTFQEGGRTFTGCDALAAVLLLQGLGVDALGVNCSLGPEAIGPIVERMLDYARLPVILQANAGLPEMREGEAVYAFDPERYAGHVLKLAARGVRVVGGCCGTTPDHIRLLRERLDGLRAERPVPALIRACTSATRMLLWDGVSVPAGRLPAQGDAGAPRPAQPEIDDLLDEALSLVDDGAALLILSAAPLGLDDPARLAEAVRALQAVTPVPLCLECSPEAAEGGLRAYNGKPALLLRGGGEDALRRMLTPAIKYGALVAVLPEDGLSPEAGAETAARMQAAARAMGLAEENLLLEPMLTFV